MAVGDFCENEDFYPEKNQLLPLLVDVSPYQDYPALQQDIPAGPRWLKAAGKVVMMLPQLMSILPADGCHTLTEHMMVHDFCGCRCPTTCAPHIDTASTGQHAIQCRLTIRGPLMRTMSLIQQKEPRCLKMKVRSESTQMLSVRCSQLD